MTKRKIILVPDEILKKKSEKIEKITINEKQLANDLFETMYKNNGIGLAAVQVGVLRRMIVIDVSKKDEKKKPLCLINPVIKSFGKDKSTYEEGCLSIPETFIEIERPKTCIVEYVDIAGNKKNMECDNLLSICIQHEINHLDGKLIIDFLSKLKKDILIKKLSKNKNISNRVIV
jgi:peptide deformylase